MVARKLVPVAPPEGAILFRVEEVAFLLRCSVATVYREMQEGSIAFRKLRRKTFIHRDDIEAYLEASSRSIRHPIDPASRPASRNEIHMRKLGLIDDDFESKPRRRSP